MSRTTCWLAALAAGALLAGCNCNNVAFDPDAGVGGGSGGGNVGVGGGSGGGTASTGGGAGGGTASTGGGAGGGTASTGGGTASTGGGAGGGTAGGAGTGGGTAGGAGTGGGTAGGAGTGGGTAGGSGGGATGGGGTGGGANCGGSVQGAYVCPTCPGASDSNNGGPNCPLATIAKGMVNAPLVPSTGFTSVVSVATRYLNSGTSITYREDVAVPAGVSLYGRYIVGNAAGGGLDWSNRGPAPTDRSVVQNTTGPGLRFLTGTSRANTIIDGMAVRTAQAGVDRMGITIVDASPTLRDVAVTGYAPGGITTPGTNEIGVFVTGRSSPRIQSTNINGIRANEGAAGLQLVGVVNQPMPSADVTGLTVGPEIQSLVAGPKSIAVGVYLENAPNTNVGDNTALSSASVGGGSTCVGVYAKGDTTAVEFNNVNASGCANPAVAPTVNAGVVFDGCTQGTSGSSPRYRNAGTISGGPVSSGVAFGVFVADGCALTIEGNGSITGATGNVTGAGNVAAGVECTYQRSGSPPGTGNDSACRIIDNRTITGSNTAGISIAAGIACVGSCATKTSACEGSCFEIRDNKAGPNGTGVSAGFATLAMNISLEQTEALVERNSFVMSTSAINGQTCSLGRGVFLRGSNAVLRNNAIIAPTCNLNASIGVDLELVNRTDGSLPSPRLVSNSIVSYVSSNAVPGKHSGIRLGPATGAVPVGGLKHGDFTGNLIIAGPGGGSAFAFEESSSSADPLVFAYNDLYVINGVDGGSPLYYDEAATIVTSILVVNDGGVANQNLPPGFNGAFPGIAPGASPLRGLGPPPGAGIPTDDWAVHNRPITGPNIDIGAYEVQ